jgi:hypothetical protein
MTDTPNMTEQDIADQETAALAEELRHFKAEKEKIRKLVGQVGGARSAKTEKIVTIVFIVVMVALFLLDVMRHVLHIPTPLPPLFSLEIGVLLVSVKIIWMIQKQSKVEHFQFWILNSIEFRLNALSKQIHEINKRIP